MGKNSKIQEYAKASSLMQIKITYGKEVFNFNLYDEVSVNENIINSQIKEQPSSYAFISMLHKKLIRIKNDKEKEMEKIYAKMFIKYKSEPDPQTGKPYSVDNAKYMAIKSNAYNEAVEAYHDAEERAEIMGTCVKAFEQRTFLLQTLSANIRKEN